jgi:methionine synthase II (cobalamin-independent)
VDAALREVGADRLWLSTTTGLEFLPHDVAVRKLEALGDAARVTGGAR